LKKTEAHTPELPDKRYFRIGEVSKLAGLPSHTLRYWETEFKNLSPTKAGTGQRMYKKNDVELILLLKQLLHEQRYTIEGARQYIKEMKHGAKSDGDGKPKKGKSKSDGQQLGFGFEEMKLKDKMKKVASELRAIEKTLRSE
jgi:DNA-binding transcriptional MerR regulator